MKTLKALKAVSAAAIASSILMAPAYTVFAEENIPQQPVVETAKSSKVVLTYNANGGTSAPKAESCEAGSVVSISNAAPVRDGYVFAGWGFSPNGDPSLYAGNVYCVEQSTTLYAIWQGKEIQIEDEQEDVETAALAGEAEEKTEKEVEQFQLMLDPTGGSMSIDHVDADEDGNVVVPDETPEKKNCTFLGWADSPETKEVVLQPGAVITLTSDMKLYAVWEEPTVMLQVMLNATGGDLTIDHVDADTNGNVILPDEIPTKEGFKFVGWAESPDTNIVSYQPGQFLTLENDMKLYAVWEAVTPEVHVTLFFDANGGVGGPTSIASNADGTVTIPTLIPVKNGFKFMGWSTDAKAAKAMYGVNQTLTLNSDLKLYAVWQADNKVNTGVENNMVMYVVAAGIAFFAAGGLYLLKRKNS